MNLIKTMLPGLQHLQNWHPLIVHFPIALLSGMALIYGASFAFRQHQWEKLAFGMLVLGTVTAGLAVWSGLNAQDGVMVARSVRAELINAHRTWMLATLGLSMALTLWAAFTDG